jgi:hypothetical protein
MDIWTKYRGIRRDGTTSLGSSAKTPDELARDLFHKGWRQATLTRDGMEVGGIGKNDAGRRIWWAESLGR